MDSSAGPLVTSEPIKAAPAPRSPDSHWINGRVYGPLRAFHFIEQPMLGFCVLGTGLPESTASIAARKSRPVTGVLFPGRLSSSCPR